MSGAWDAIGWTAQGPADYADGSSRPGAWRMPDDVDMVTVSGAFRDADGGQPSGYILFEASSDLTHVATGDVLLQPQFYVLIDAYGNYHVSLPATDSPALTTAPEKFTYKATLVIGRKFVRSFTCELPLANPTVKFNELVPLDENAEPTYVLNGGTP